MVFMSVLTATDLASMRLNGWSFLRRVNSIKLRKRISTPYQQPKQLKNIEPVDNYGVSVRHLGLTSRFVGISVRSHFESSVCMVTVSVSLVKVSVIPVQNTS